jgi:hypothetical protein
VPPVHTQLFAPIIHYHVEIPVGKDGRMWHKHAGTQFTCFTGTMVPTLTPEELRAENAGYSMRPCEAFSYAALSY